MSLPLAHSKVQELIHWKKLMSHMVRDKDPVCYLLCISSFPNTALLLLWSLDSIFLTVCSYMPILVTSILQMKEIEKRSGLVSVIY